MSDNGDNGGNDDGVERFVIRCRGLPWSCTNEELVEFFAPEVEVDTENIHMTTNREGRPSGEAYIQVSSKDDVDEAVKKHRKNMGKRYVEVEHVVFKTKPAAETGWQKLRQLFE